jgi:hypothetical protein
MELFLFGFEDLPLLVLWPPLQQRYDNIDNIDNIQLLLPFAFSDIPLWLPELFWHPAEYQYKDIDLLRYIVMD